MGMDGAYNTKMDFYDSFMSLSPSIRVSLSQTFNQLIRSCTYQGRDCLDEKYFQQIVSPTYGNCYIFNGNITRTQDKYAGKRNSTLTGPNYGLTLLLHLDNDNYMPSTVSQTVGARAIIHTNNMFPLLDEAGMDLTPYAVTSISMGETRIHRQPAPYQSKCYSSWSQTGVQPVEVNTTTRKTAFTGERYSLAECHRICLQVRITRHCNCHHVLYPLSFAVNGALHDVKASCDLTYGAADANCTSAVVNDIYSSALPDCTCSVPCQEVTYEPQLSMATWPQGMFLGSLLKKIEFVPMDNYTDTNSLEKWSKQFVKLNVYFRGINSAVITESAVFTYTTFITSLGGALSLYLGIALILVVEVLEYIFFLVCNTLLFLLGRFEDVDKSTQRVKPAVIVIAPEYHSPQPMFQKSSVSKKQVRLIDRITTSHYPRP